MDQRGRIVMTRLAKRSEIVDRAFDIDFWQSLTDKERFSAAWELVEIAHKMKGGRANELRLQRSIGGIKRRER
jgi:hypothetical protein